MKKRILGQFFTKNNIWLKKHIRHFILKSNCKIAYDPFAGDGDLLNLAKSIGIKKTVGLDLEPTDRSIRENDSLIFIPHIDDAIIITNPPYLTNYSAKRKNIYNNVEKYFNLSDYEDLYLVALEKMLLAQDYVVAIVPETFINSNFKNKSRLKSITIIEENCFSDTENPVCVVCFDGNNKSYDSIKVFKNDKYLNTLNYYEKLRMVPKKTISIKFNDVKGNIAIRAIDTTNPNKMISFMKKEELDYNLDGIKHSSRLITVVNIGNLKKENVSAIIKKGNDILNSYRIKSDDVLLSPFKCNMKNGKRRRRLDYETARAILEIAYMN